MGQYQIKVNRRGGSCQPCSVLLSAGPVCDLSGQFLSWIKRSSFSLARVASESINQSIPSTRYSMKTYISRQYPKKIPEHNKLLFLAIRFLAKMVIPGNIIFESWVIIPSCSWWQLCTLQNVPSNCDSRRKKLADHRHRRSDRSSGLSSSACRALRCRNIYCHSTHS